MSRTQLLAMGRDDSDIRRAVVAGTLVRLRPGWYAGPDADASTTEAVRRGGVLSCVSALRHHGLWIPPGHTEVHVRYSRHGTSAARGRRCRGQGRALPLATAVDDVPVALDCATRCLTRDEWIVVCDSALEKSKWSVRRPQSEMPACIARTPEWMTHCDGRSQSGTETLVRLRLRELVAGWLKLRLTYDDVIHHWDEVLADIRAVTRAGRHRIRG